MNHMPNKRMKNLDDWLDIVEARCVWDMRDSNRSVECWIVGGRPFIVVRVHDESWNIYTAADTVSISMSLADAERRLKLDERCMGCHWPVSTVSRTIGCQFGDLCRCGSGR